MNKLGAHCFAINELRDCLGEESISKLFKNENTVEFSVQSGGSKLRFLFQADDTYPHPSSLLLCTNQETLNLESLNAKLSQGTGSLGKALSLLGRQLDLDLDWALEALNDLDGGNGGSPEGDTSEDDNDENMSEDEDMSDHDIDVLREWSRKMLHLEALEQQKANEAKKNEGSNSAEVEMEHFEKQIFDTRAAFRRLLNELEEIFKAKDINLMVDAPSEEGLFLWDIYLAGFNAEKSNLAIDLHRTGRRFGLSSVHLQIKFKRGLHPFYPPSVRLLSPRFKDPILGAIACFPQLQPRNWDPVTSAKDVILNIKQFLEEHGRVDLDSSTQTYHPTEVLVTRLSALTGIQPKDPAASPEIVYSFENAAAAAAAAASGGGGGGGGGNGGKDLSPASKKLRTVMNVEPPATAIVGGGGGGGGATANNIEKEQPPEIDLVSGDEVDEPEQTPYPEISGKTTPEQQHQAETKQAIAWNKGVGYGSGVRSKNKHVWDAKRAEALQDARDTDLHEVLSLLAQEAEKVFNNMEDTTEGGDQRAVVTVLTTGCLVPFLIKELSSAGFQGMVPRAAYYRALIECVHVLCLHPETASMLFWHAEDDLKCLATAISSLKAQAATFLKVLGDQATGSSSETEEDSKLATLLLQVADKVESAVAGSNNNDDIGTTPTAVVTATVAAAAITDDSQDTPMISEDRAHAENRESEAHYVSIMSPFKVSLVPGIAANHLFQPSASREETAPSRQRARRVASELASLESDLPVNASSSVFVCADEQQTILWKALITGPKGTPYESGCFLFDIYFPLEYPNRAPSVKLRTTGGGTVRFNPNLYKCGRVCLSLLGTWHGEQGESWSAEYSSILQVLISIQSLILVDQPFYNEPGYEARPDDSASNVYSAGIMVQTVKWAMIDQLKSPPAYFADAIKSHFRERGEVILATVRRWADWCTEIGSAKSAAAIKMMLLELESEIMKLKNK